MAIAKMRKLSLYTLPAFENELLEHIQELKGVHIDKIEVEETVFEQLGEDINTLELEQKISELQTAQGILEKHVPQPSFIQKNRSPKPTYNLRELKEAYDVAAVNDAVTLVYTLRDRLNEIDIRLDEIESEREDITPWQKINVHPDRLEKLKNLQVLIGTIPQATDRRYIHALEAFEGLEISEIYQNQEEHGLILALPKNIDMKEFNEALIESHFEEWQYEYDELPQEKLANLSIEEKDLKAEEKNIQGSLREKGDVLEQLRLAEEYEYAKLLRLNTRSESLLTNYLFVLSGYMEADKTADFSKKMNDVLPENAYVLEVSDVSEADEETVPTLLTNNSITEPFEELTLMYGTPNYNELDPTPYVMVFYSVFYGMMMGDLGYGLLQWIGTFLLLKFLHLDDGFKKMVKMFHILSYPTMIVGLIYGSFFGVTIPTQLVNITEQATEVLVFSIGLGIIHILSGLVLNAVNQFRQGNPGGAIKDGISWIVILLGLIIGAAGTMLFQNEMISNIGFGLSLVAALVILVLSVVLSQNKFGGLAAGVYDLYGISGYIGDMVSYSRLMALGLSGSSIAVAFNMLIGMLPTPYKFTIGVVLIIVLQLFNMFLSVLSAYVHGMRLIFVEFFGKFFDGTGTAFKPLKGLEKFINISER